MHFPFQMQDPAELDDDDDNGTKVDTRSNPLTNTSIIRRFSDIQPL